MRDREELAGLAAGIILALLALPGLAVMVGVSLRLLWWAAGW